MRILLDHASAAAENNHEGAVDGEVTSLFPGNPHGDVYLVDSIKAKVMLKGG